MPVPDFIPAEDSTPDFIPAEEPKSTPQPSAWQTFTQPTEKTDKEYLGYKGPAGVVGATLHGLNKVAGATGDAIKGAISGLDPRPQGDETWEGNISDTLRNPVSVIGKRAIRGAVDTGKAAAQVPAAVKDINSSSDPAGTYANAAEDTASQGAGQALTALATEGAARTIPKVVQAVPKIAQTGVRLGARTAESALNQKLVPVKSLLNINTPADQAEAVHLKVPGRDLGLSKRAASSLPETPKAANPVGPIGANANAAETIKPTVTKIADQVQEGLGGKKLVPNLPLRMQAGGPGPKVAPAAASIEPEHMGQFARANGLDLHRAIPETVEGDVLRAKIHNLSNIQVRQLAINAGEDMGQARVGNRKMSDDLPRQEVLKRVMAKHSPEEIGQMIDQGKHLPGNETRQ